MGWLAKFIDAVMPGDIYDGKTIISVEPPQKGLQQAWIVRLKGESGFRVFTHDSQLLVEDKSQKEIPSKT